MGPPLRRCAIDLVTIARFGPPLTVLALAGPVLAGLAGTLLPAFGYLPALGGGALSLDPFRQLFAEHGLMISVLLSLTGGLAVTAAALFVVMFFFAGWVDTPVFDRVRHLVSPLLAVPHAAAAFGIAFLIAPSGLVARLVSPELTGWQTPPDVRIVGDPYGVSLIFGLALKEIPFLFLLALAALPQTQSLQAARITASMGYGRAAGFLFAVWPRLYSQIRLGVFAVLAFSTSVVDVAAILGPTTPAPLSVRLVTWMSDPDLAMRFKASAGAVLQLGVTALALLIWIAGEALVSRWMRLLAARGVRQQRDNAVRAIARLKMAAAAVTVFAGLTVLAVWSVAGLWPFPDALPRSFTVGAWANTLPRLAEPMATTLIVAVIATFVAVALVMLCLLREDETGRHAGRPAMALVYLPLIVPQAAFLFGLQFLFLLVGLQASMTALILAHLVFVLPYVFLSLSDPWRAFDRRFEAISAGLGKSRLQTLWRIRLPQLLRPLLVAVAIGFAVSIGQYLPTLLIGAGRLPTITTEAVALASGGNRRIIGVYAFVQMLLPAIGFAIAIAMPALIFRRFRAMRA
jgi:putative thiamine transport system permease protein